MSNAFGIAAVTHVLKDLLNDGLVYQNVSAAVGSAINVTSLPPGQVEPQQGSPTNQLNLFMYRVSYNTGLNSFGYPSRNARGGLVNNPPLALNLHYLLIAFGEEELHAEILLGYGMQLLHENPVLDRNLIRNSLSSANASNPDGRLPENLLALASSGLSEQIEQIKITPEPLTTEEMSKLWTAIQSRYRPCTGYLATVVLIESDKPTSSPLPVLQRNVYVFPFRQPNIHKILSSENAPNAKITELRRIITGDILILQGEQLKSNGVVVKIGDVEILPDVANITGTRISVELDASLELKAGVHGVQVVQPNVVVEGKRIPANWEEIDEWASAISYAVEDVVVINSGVEESSLAYCCIDPHISNGDFAIDLVNAKWEEIAKRRMFKGNYSNLLAFVLSPTLINTNVETDPLEPGWFNIEVNVVPGLRKGQRVMLILNETNLAAEIEPISYSFPLPPEVLATITDPLHSVTFGIKSGIKVGQYLVRLQVDGAASPLTTNDDGKFIGPTLIIS
ncbi:DUF4255 domain-containing protein [Lunatibacter salilacus]|uniref:DUF4255 domain-containing protein n=1 Tax=Lunatibacter salilacus TaxID=2483804 RepID=UPI00131D1B57|nr:DUF4255 domain-containing protein [Lunatibacter salilacus]